MSTHKPFLLLSLLLIVATLAVYWQAGSSDFVVYDDPTYVMQNLHVQHGLSWDGLGWAFRATDGSNWHPVTWLTFMFGCHLFGFSAPAQHWINLLLHFANSVLFFWVFLRMTTRVWPSFVVAALFALHPLHVESVAWISERKDVLSTLFWALTMLAYVRYVEKPGASRFLLTLLMFALGLMSKAMLVTLPCVLLLLDFWPLRRLQFPEPEGTPAEPGWRLPAGLGRIVVEKIPFLALVVLFCWITLWAQTRGGAMALTSLTLEQKLSNAAVAYVRYLGKTFYPADLAVLYPYVFNWPFWQVFGAGLLLALITVIPVSQWRQKPYLLIGWCWFIGTLVPVIGLIQVGVQSMADRYTYVPLIGIFVMLAYAAADWAANSRLRASLLNVLAGSVLVVCTAITVLQVKYWKNSITLFEHTLQIWPDNPVLHINLGNILMQQGKWDEATRHFTEAVRKNPNYALAWANMADLLGKQGDNENALKYLETALQLVPTSAGLQNSVGNLLLKMKKTEEALAHYQRATELKPDSIEAYIGLASTLNDLGKVSEAVEAYRECLRINPDSAEVRNNLAWLLATAADLKDRNASEAIQLAEQACQATRYKQPFYIGKLAAAYAAAGRFDNAIKTGEVAAELAVQSGNTNLADLNRKLLKRYRDRLPPINE